MFLEDFTLWGDWRLLSFMLWPDDHELIDELHCATTGIDSLPTTFRVSIPNMWASG